jgi:hypothetical protein
MDLLLWSGNLHFPVEENLLLVSDGTEIVIDFGIDREVIVPGNVKILRISCFEHSRHLDRIF